MTKTEIYTDGSILKNPGGQGGYAAVIKHGTLKLEVSGGFKQSTNNRMEMMAVIMGLWEVKKNFETEEIKIISDSKYVVDGFGYSKVWKDQCWMTNAGTPAKNKDLWQLMHAFGDEYKLDFNWVKGHAGHPENERCDELAGIAARGDNLLIDKGYGL